jgi:hypothetical protein
MAQAYSISTKGATPKNIFGNTSSGIIGSINKATGLQPSSQSQSSLQISQGTNQGLINMSKPDTTYTHSTTTNEKGGTSIKPVPNPSVLAQQQSLNQANKNTQGYVPLIEDGLAGPKTQSAIEKYGFNSQTGQPNTPKTTNTPATAPVEKPVSSAVPAEQIQNVGQAGQQTQNEIETQKRLMELSQEGSPEYQQAQANYQKAIEDYNSSIQNQAGAMAGEASRAIPLGFVQGRQQVLQSQYGAQQAGLGGLVQGAGSALGAANTQQQLQTAAGQAAYTGAQTQAGRGLTAQGQVLQAGLLQPTTIGQVPFSSVTGNQGQMIGGQGGLSQLGALQQQQQQGSQTQAMIGAYNQAEPLIKTAKQQIESAGFNISPVALVNQLQQFVNKGIIPSAEYANIFNTLSEIATTISPVLGAQGAQTDLKTMIAQEFIPKLMQGQDIGMVLDNIEKNALAKIEANKQTAQGTTLQVPSSSTTGGSIWDW